MIISKFIASRLQNRQNGSFSGIAGTIAVSSIAAGLTVSLVAFSILFGFKETIRQKIFSFGGHLQLSRYDLNFSFEESPIPIHTHFLAICRENREIKSIYPFATKAGLIKKEQDVQGAVLKGVGPDYDWSVFEQNIVEGRKIHFPDTTDSKEILLSKKTKLLLNVKLNDELVMFFIQQPPRYRKLKVVGIYETGMEEFDEVFTLGDIRLIRRLNNWADTLAGGYEVMVSNFDQIDNVSKFVFEEMDYDLGLEKVTDKYIQLFDWLELLNRNVYIFLVIILIVASFNMISSLLIIMMERTQMIGLLKALGASNKVISVIFFRNGMEMVLKGMFFGNIFGLGFCVAQDIWHLIPLNPENYYMNTVPIYWDWLLITGLNLGLLLLMSLVLWLPSMMIARISPIRSIRFH